MGDDDTTAILASHEADYSPSGEDRIATTHVASRSAVTRSIRLQAMRAIKAETFSEVAGPSPLSSGQTMHAISRGQFDTATIIAHYANTIGRIERLSASSLSISRQSIDVLADLENDALLGTVRIMVQDLTMRRSEHREHIDAIRTWMHGHPTHTLRCAETHAKVYVMEFADTEQCPLVMESSANLTSNDNRLEQYAITASRDLATFHLDWMDEIFGYDGGQLPRNAFPGDERLRGAI